ncbi:ZIP family metal transporter [Hyphomonas pacifica]|uniref:ZIP family metal transporter n=1 Tax=Hyphomonas pacifica TaxID=1280941 RepID=UPI000DBF8995|nr:zinc transporter [Hyphomonas pacifica]RAN33569.1 hypothetical protein HY11_16360 [Hyphomonas pacifica]
MLMVLLIVAIVSGALVIGALWGLYGKLPTRLEGFLVSIAGGALVISAVSELIEPTAENTSILTAVVWTLVGAAIFTGCDYLIDKYWGESQGGGLLAAITLDGIPENLALGVALIGAEPLQVAALAGSILLSNLPEAAGGAKEMRGNDMAKSKALMLWVGTALLLSAAALAGNILLSEAGATTLGAIKCVAGGAVVASLAAEVFPKAYNEDRNFAGFATALGFLLALWLGQIGK